MSETERAIEYFKQYETYLGNKISEYLSKSFNSVGEYTEELTKEKSVYSLAITALKQQSEAERKCERVSRFCKTQRSLIRNGKAQPDVKLLTDIIWILEGTADV